MRFALVLIIALARSAYAAVTTNDLQGRYVFMRGPYTPLQFCTRWLEVRQPFSSASVLPADMLFNTRPACNAGSLVFRSVLPTTAQTNDTAGVGAMLSAPPNSFTCGRTTIGAYLVRPTAAITRLFGLLYRGPRKYLILYLNRSGVYCVYGEYLGQNARPSSTSPAPTNTTDQQPVIEPVKQDNSTNVDAEEAKQKGGNMWLWLGPVIAVVVIIPFVITYVVCCCCAKKNTADDLNKDSPHSVTSSSPPPSLPPKAAYGHTATSPAYGHLAAPAQYANSPLPPPPPPPPMAPMHGGMPNQGAGATLPLPPPEEYRIVLPSTTRGTN